MGSLPCQKGAKREGFEVAKRMAGGRLKCISDASRAAGVQATSFIRHVRNCKEVGALRGIAWSIGPAGLRDSLTSYNLVSLFRGICSALDRWSGKVAMERYALARLPQHCTQLSMLGGRLAEFLRFRTVNVHFVRKSPTHASFWTRQLPLAKKSPIVASFQIRDR